MTVSFSTEHKKTKQTTIPRRACCLNSSITFRGVTYTLRLIQHAIVRISHLSPCITFKKKNISNSPLFKIRLDFEGRERNSGEAIWHERTQYVDVVLHVTECKQLNRTPTVNRSNVITHIRPQLILISRARPAYTNSGKRNETKRKKILNELWWEILSLFIFFAVVCKQFECQSLETDSRQLD